MLQLAKGHAETVICESAVSYCHLEWEMPLVNTFEIFPSVHNHSTCHLKTCVGTTARVIHRALHVQADIFLHLGKKQITTSLATSYSAGQEITNKCCYSLFQMKMCPMITSSAEEVFEPTRIKHLQNPAKVKLGNFLHLPSF